MRYQAMQMAFWKNKLMTDKIITVKMDRLFSPEEMKNIENGAIPEEMEDKWFLYMEDNILYFHRSWTGTCLYIARFKQEGDSFKLYEADINRDPEQYTETDVETDITAINRLIDRILLPERIEENDDLNKSIKDWSLFGRI